MSPSMSQAVDASPPPSSRVKRSAKTPATPPKLDRKAGGSKGRSASVVVPKKKEKRVRKPKPGMTPKDTRDEVKVRRRKLAIKKALKVQKKVIKSANNDGKKRVRKARTSIRFHRPRTFRPARNPKFPRMSVPKRNKLDIYNIIQYPLVSEAAMKKIEDQNTLVFICHTKANKFHIRAATTKLLNVEVVKVNILNCPNGKKKAYVKLSKGFDALDQASKLGII